GELAQRNIGVHAGWSLEADFDIADRLETGTIFRRKPNDDAELSVGLEQRGRRCAAQCRVDNGVDVAGIKAVSGRLLAIDLDIQIGLATNPKYSEILDSLDLLQFTQNLTCKLLEDDLVAANDLDRIGPLDAGQRLFDVVLNVLRKIEIHSR